MLLPRATQRLLLTAVAAGSLILGMSALPAAWADELEDRQDRVEGDIGATRDELDQSSTDLAAASRALDAAQTQLGVARAQLSRTRDALASAEALDQRMQVKLADAVRRLDQARDALAEGRVDLAVQEETLGQIAVQNYQSGDPQLLGLSMVLNSQNPNRLTSQLNSVQNVLDKESVTLDRLEASRVLLTVHEVQVADAKREVAAQRGAAARNLVRKQGLESDAQAAEAQVSELTRARAAARVVAVRARAADLTRLRALEQERDRISELLRQRAREARLRAAAEAAAAAAAAEAAAESAAAKAAAAEAAAAAAADPGGAGLPAGEVTSSGLLGYPVDGYITSPYGMRLHPIYHRWTLHDGTDFGAGCGTPIRAAAGGTVVATYYNAGYGNRVILDNGIQRGVGLGTAYNHLSSYAVSAGDRVARGEVIGYVGSTGYSTGCHLHFMVFENGVTVDPMGWL